MVVAMLSDYPTFRHSTIIDATLQDLRIILPRLYHHWCYVLRSSLQSPNTIDATDLQVSTIIEATLKDLLTFYPHWCYVFQMSCHFLPLYHHWCYGSKIFSAILRHDWCYALRYSLQLSTYLKLRSKIFSSSFNHQRCYAPRSSLQFSNIIDATL